MPLYHRFQDVKIRLIGKVRFTEDENDENKMQISLALRLMDEAEGEVEEALSPRYMAPFQTVDGCPFTKLPPRPTGETIRTLCELVSVMKILETDFGRGGPADSKKYSEALKERFDNIVNKRLLAKRDQSYNTWAYPPMPGLRLNFHNAPADTGYAGEVINTSDQPNGMSFPSERMNDPSQTFWNVSWDDLGGFT